MSENTRIFGKALKDFNISSENFSLDVSNMTAALQYDGTEISSSLSNPTEFIKKFRTSANISPEEAYKIIPLTPEMSKSHGVVLNYGIVANAAAGLNIGTAAGAVTFVAAALAVVVIGALWVIPSPDPRQSSNFLKVVNKEFLGSLIKAAIKSGGLKFANDIAVEYISHVRRYNGVGDYAE